MQTLRLPGKCCAAGFAGLLIWIHFATPARAAITGQWDFNNNDLSATIGQPMEYYDVDTQAATQFGTTTSFGIPDINGQPAQVMRFPKVTEFGGYYVFHGAAPNGEGFFVNQYTILMDVLFPAESSDKPRALIQADTILNAEFLINANNAIGHDGGAFDGTVSPNTWHRIAFAVDAAANPPTVAKFIDGVKVGERTLGAGIDGRFSLDSYFLLFNDDTAEAEAGYLNSLQFRDEKLSDGLIAALGGPTAEGILTGPPPNPYVVSLSPSPESAVIPGRSSVSPSPVIEIVIEDGQASVDTNSVRLTFDNQAVTPAVTKTGTTTVVSYRVVDTLLEPLSLHRVNLAFNDTATPPNALGAQWQFAVGPFLILSPETATPPGSASDPGFIVRTVQGPAYIPEANNPTNFPVTVERAIRQLNGTLRDVDDNLVEDESIPGPGPRGSYEVDTVIDFGTTGTPVGNFEQDTFFPGIPGATDHSTQFATEVLTFLELPAGVHRFGMSVNVSRVDVNDDDGYTLFSGLNPRNYFSTVVGTFQNLTGGFPENAQNNNEFTFYAPTNGVYPFRLVYYQGGRDGSLEWYSVDPETGDKILINDPDNPRSIKAFKTSSAPNTLPPYIAQVDPRPNTSGHDPAAPIEILVDDDKTDLNPDSIQLFLNDTAVTPTISKSGDRTTIRFEPDPARTNPTNIVRLVYADNASPTPNVITNSWGFGIAVQSGPGSTVKGQWDFDNGDLRATVGLPLEYFDGPDGQTASKTRFGSTTSFGISDINGEPAMVMEVPGDLSNQIGYIMRHGIAPNGGGTRVNQYTLIYDVYVVGGGGAAALLQISSLNNTDDGDLFWQGNNFGQGGGGYNGTGIFTPDEWHRVAVAVDLAADPPVITKFVDGVKQDDWVQQELDQDRRALREYAILFADGDQDERRMMYVNSIQIREGKLSDAELEALGGPSADGIPGADGVEPPDAPELEIQVAGENVTISWPADVSGLTLESTASLTPPVTWTAVTGVTGNSVTVPIEAGARFFRLRQ